MSTVRIVYFHGLILGADNDTVPFLHHNSVKGVFVIVEIVCVKY